MNDANTVLEIIRMVGNFAVAPLCVILWNMQGRLSRIEGMIASRNPTQGK